MSQESIKMWRKWKDWRLDEETIPSGYDSYFNIIEKNLKQRPADKEVQRIVKAEAKLRERMIKLEQIFLRDARPENVKLSKDLQKIYKETVTKFMREMIKLRKKLK